MIHLKQLTKRNKQILAAICLCLCLSAPFFYTSMCITNMTVESCFDTLSQSTRQLGMDIRRNVETDRVLLEKTARLIASQEEITGRETLLILDTAEGSLMLSQMEILFPDNRVLTHTGDWIDTDGSLSFTEESARGAHISGMETAPDSGQMIVRSYVPIVKDGQNLAMLIGVIDLRRLPEFYTAEAFDGNAQVYILEGKNGHFLMDTWHSDLGNMNEFSDRKAMQGYSTEDTKGDLSAGRAGRTAFLSQTSGEYFYSIYEPVGINDWMVLLSVHESIALSKAHQIQRLLYVLALLEAIILAVYFLWLLHEAHREATVREQELGRIQYILDVEKTLFNSPRNPELFKTALHKIAVALSAGTAFFIAFSTQEEAQFFLWKKDHSLMDGQVTTDSLIRDFPCLYAQLRKYGHIISYHIEDLVRESPEESRRLRDYDLSSLMLIPVEDLDGRQIGVLGAANLQHRWNTTELLECVMLSFSMALNNMESFRTIKRMGTMDEQTGLMNRNSYQSALESYENGPDTTLACVYVDVDGLHEINNNYGHVAGDHMLQVIAEAMKTVFGTADTYRIGGDEFISFCSGLDEEQLSRKICSLNHNVSEHGYHISIGTEWRHTTPLVYEMVKQAEKNMYKAKQLYYEHLDDAPLMRGMNHQLEELLTEKRDLDVFRSMLSSKYAGVYIVNMSLDAMRSIYIPSYFAETVRKAGGKFSSALRIYIHDYVLPEYQPEFLSLLDYGYVEERLAGGDDPELLYQRTDGVFLMMHIHRSPDYSGRRRECLWTFETTDIS